MASEPDIGRYLLSVMERDIDLLLMEEFHCEPGFVETFCRMAGIDGTISFDGAWHSLNDIHGETDLLLRVRCDHQRIGILIENKVAAQAQPRQDERYHLRARSALNAGLFDRYVTVICAPASYLSGVPRDSQYQFRISYENIRDWFTAQPGSRASWRASIMSEAIEQGRRGYTMIVHAARSAFHMDYWEFLTRHYPQFHMHKPTPKGGQSSWIRFKGHSFPKGVTLNYKGDRNVLDLEFQRLDVMELSARRMPDWPDEILTVQTGKSAVLRLSVPRCDFDQSLAEQEEQVRQIMDAAVRLAEFADLMT